MVEIKGLEKFAPRDFPGHISSTVFVGGCNFLCPFCHNVDLVLRPREVPSFPMDYFLEFLDSRKDWLGGICVSGGEPLIHEDLEVLLRLIKERDFLVKLDTNGSFADRLKELMAEKLIDNVAMDIKAPLEKYERAAGKKVDPEEIRRSVALIRTSGLSYSFRTTVVPGLIEKEDILEISRFLEGAELFQIQQYSPDKAMDPKYRKLAPYTDGTIKEFAKAAEPYFKKIRIEGV